MYYVVLRLYIYCLYIIHYKWYFKDNILYQERIYDYIRIHVHVLTIIIHFIYSDC